MYSNHICTQNQKIFNNYDMDFFKSVVANPKVLLNSDVENVQQSLVEKIENYFKDNTPKFDCCLAGDKTQIGELLEKLVVTCQQFPDLFCLIDRIQTLKNKILQEAARKDILRLPFDILNTLADLVIDPQDLPSLFASAKHHPFIQLIKNHKKTQHFFEVPAAKLGLTQKQLIRFYCQWAHIYQKPAISLDFSHCKHLTNIDLKKLANTFKSNKPPHLVFLKLPKFSECTIAGIESISQITTLKSISFPVKSTELKSLSAKCHQLEKIILENQKYTSQLDYFDLVKLKCLKSIDLSHHHTNSFQKIVDQVTAGTLTWPWPNLENLNLNYLVSLNLTNQQIATCLTHSTALKSLYLMNVDSVNSELVNILKNRSNIESCNLSSLRTIPINNLTELFQWCNIKNLFLSNCYLDDRDLASFFKILKNLETFEVDGTFEKKLAAGALAQFCMKLKSIKFPVTPSTIPSEFVKNLPRHSGLESFFGYNITNESFSLLVNKCPQLKKLIIHKANINDNNLEDLVRCCPQLKVLNIYLTKITAEGLSKLAKKLKIRELSIGHHLFTKKFILTMEKEWSQTLQSLTVFTSFPDVTKKAPNREFLLRFIKAIRYLYHIRLETFPLLVEDVKELLTVCPYLDSLSVQVSDFNLTKHKEELSHYPCHLSINEIVINSS